MPYIGSQQGTAAPVLLDAISVVNGQAAYTLQKGGLNYKPASALTLQVSLNGIIQAPTSSYTVSGSTITFDSALVTGDVIDYILDREPTTGTMVPLDGSVTDAKVASGISASKLTGTLPALDGSNLTGVGVAGISSSSTSGTALNIDANNIVTLPNLVAFSAEWRAGSPANGYLQDWTVRSNQGSAFNGTTGRFTPPVNGTYVFHVNILAEDHSGSTTNIDLQKNETDVLFKIRDDTQNGRFQTISGSVIADLTTSDFVSVYKDTLSNLSKHSDPWHIFSGHLLG